VRALLASPLGFLIGLSLGALGGGGSILAVPALVYAAGQDPKAATTTSLFLVGSAALVGMVGHWHANRVRVGTGLMFGAIGIFGSLAGSALNRRIDPDALLLGFSVLVVIAAWRMLTACPTCTKVGEEVAMAGFDGEHGHDHGHHHDPSHGGVDAVRIAKIVAAGTAVGFLTGLFGVGGGFVIVPALALILELPMPEAIGTSLLVIAINSAVALSTRIATTTIDWNVTIPFTIAAILGVMTGSKLADRLHPERSLRWFAALLVAVAAYTAISALMGLV
jgi:uncharacterized membrane protein YfcA